MLCSTLQIDEISSKIVIRLISGRGLLSFCDWKNKRIMGAKDMEQLKYWIKDSDYRDKQMRPGECKRFCSKNGTYFFRGSIIDSE